MTTFYPTWEEAERNRNRNLGAKHPDAEEVAMGNNEGRQMYYVRKVNAEIPEGPQCAACGDETCTASDAHHTVTEFTTAETTHAVTLVTELDETINVAQFGTDAKRAEAHQRLLVTMITLSREPLPAMADHGPNWTTWTVSGEHDTFGSWRVILSASEDGAEQCGTCGEWFTDSDAWGEHNDMAHY